MSARAVMVTAILLANMAQASAQQSIMGGWARGDGLVRVNVAPCGKIVCMTNVDVKPGTDDKIGERVEFTLDAGGGDKLSGTMFDPKGKNSYPVTITVAGSTMTTRGCALGGIVCKNVGWTRAN